MSRLSTKQRRAARRRHEARRFRVTIRCQAPIPGTVLAFTLRDPNLATPEVVAWLEECGRRVGDEMRAMDAAKMLTEWDLLAGYVAPRLT